MNKINNKPKTENLILIPIYNEQKHIFNVLREVRKYLKDDILVINDGSTDESKEIIEEISSCAKLKGELIIINHSINEGYGQSLIDGINFAQNNNYKYLVTLDCDEQHEPHLIPQFLKEIKKGKVDIVSGSRYLSPQRQIDTPPQDRYRINRQITKLINKITNYGLTDSFCGFKAYRVESLKKLKLSEKGYGFPLQLLIQAYKNNLTIKELPVSMIYKDKTRTFGNYLDDPEKRLAYYQKIIDNEVKRCSIY
ncbi:MAG TPA: glycosyltransferase family 2 protein [Candidatus Atribacteria bacterium]|nr:glycosyltransferase family 2 protein [Candidatus Atribacteria bacterium]